MTDDPVAIDEGEAMEGEAKRTEPGEIVEVKYTVSIKESSRGESMTEKYDLRIRQDLSKKDLIIAPLKAVGLAENLRAASEAIREHGHFRDVQFVTMEEMMESAGLTTKGKTDENDETDEPDKPED